MSRQARSSDEEEEEVRPFSRSLVDEPLKKRVKYGYGLGHVLNDLCASMWFTYLLLFFHKVLEFENINAGFILLIGQIADGLATPFVGYFSDKGDNFWLCNKYGIRKSWHLIGTVCVLLSFPFIFLPALHCPDFHHCDQSAELVYYSAFVVIFQFGWAATQISHLSMIPDITPSTNERTGLTAIRYTMTVVSNIGIYVLTWIFLGMKSEGELVGPQDQAAFRNIMLIAVCVGGVSSLAFHFSVKLENNEENRLNGGGEGFSANSVVRRMGVRDWLKEPQFYQVAGVYMCTRLFVNLSQAYVPLYLQISLQLHAQYVAIIPLVMFIFGLVTSTVMKTVNHNVGRKITFVSGALVGIGGCIWVKAGNDSNFVEYEIFGVAALLGAGGSTMLITSLSVTAELISHNSECGAFVYGSMSLSDKLSNGLAVILIQHFIPNNIDSCSDCRQYYRDILFYICGGAALLGILCMLTLGPFSIGERWRDRRSRQLRAFQEPSQRQDQIESPRRVSESTPLIS